MWAQKIHCHGRTDPSAEEMLNAAKAKERRPSCENNWSRTPQTAELDRAWRLVTHDRHAEAKTIYKQVAGKGSQRR